MITKRILLNSSMEISSKRPSADKSIEQYLMTSEGMASQISILGKYFNNKKVLFLGDDDHISVLMAKYANVKPMVLEYDDRVIGSLKNFYDINNISDYKIEKYDVRSSIPKSFQADVFYINPPYSSKNNGRGAKVWVYRASKCVPIGSTSVLVYPIDENLLWTMSCLREIIDFAYKCGLCIVDIDKDVHTYEHLPNDPGLTSSNIYLYKFANNKAPMDIKDINDGALYR